MHIFDSILKSLEECSFGRWYPIFSKIAIRGFMLPIPDDVMQYLRDERVILPKECYPAESNEVIEFQTEIRSPTSQEDENDSLDDLLQPEFPDFSRKLAKMIAQFEGDAAFLKTRWHCPKDSFWITTGRTSKVTDITDVYQLLKASSIVKQDLFDHGLPEKVLKSIDCSKSRKKHANAENKAVNYIVLKEWHEIHPGTEFRCFVRRNNLIAISPRDWPAYHQFIVQQKREICSDIVTIFKENIKMQFSLDDYTFDVIRSKKDHVIIVDFSPFHSDLTDSLAFDWPELTDESCFLEEDTPEFRYLPNDCGIQPSKRNNYGVPMDIINMFNKKSYEDDDSLDLATLMINRAQNVE